MADKKWYKSLWVIALIVVAVLVVAALVFRGPGLSSDPVDAVSQSLNVYGYNVIYTISSSSNPTANFVSVKMNSSGSESDQVSRGMIALEMAYPEAKDYSVVVVKVDEECEYVVSGDVQRAWSKLGEGGDILVGGQEISASELYQLRDSQVSSGICS